jgi:hypothetical protein
MTDNVRLDGKVAIVTGSGRGLGQAIKEADLFRSGKPIKFGKYTIRDFGTSRRDSAPRKISSFLVILLTLSRLRSHPPLAFQPIENIYINLNYLVKLKHFQIQSL